MSFFEKLNKKYEDRILAKAQKISEERARIEEERKAEALRKEEIRQKKIAQKEQEIKKLLNSKIEEEYIVCLHRSIKDNQGDSYAVYDYFLSSVRRADFGYGDEAVVIKITGDNFGDKFVLHGHGTSLFSVELTDKNGAFWEGNTCNSLCISGCKTIKELNDYANNDNLKLKREYEQKKIDTQRINETFFK